MDIVAKNEIAFHNVKINLINRNNQIWLSSKEIANALGYAKTNAITHIYNKNSDEFSSGMTEVVESTTSGNLKARSRIFSLRGAHLIAMFARTGIAKEFRKWVLDILDKEAAKPIVKAEPKVKALQPPSSIDPSGLIFKLDMMNNAWNAAYQDIQLVDPRMAEYLNRIMGSVMVYTMHLKNKVQPVLL